MTLRIASLGALLALVTGCYSFVYHARKDSTDHNEVAVDWIKPHSSVKWGTWWGIGYTWEPIGCSYADGTTTIVGGRDEDKACVAYFALCENGVGRVEWQPQPYAIPLAVLTLGAFFASELTAYCSTESSPDGPSGPSDDGPSGPSVPSGPSGPSASVPLGDATSGETHARATH